MPLYVLILDEDTDADGQSSKCLAASFNKDLVIKIMHNNYNENLAELTKDCEAEDIAESECSDDTAYIRVCVNYGSTYQWTIHELVSTDGELLKSLFVPKE